METRLDNKRILITGAAGGIGQAVARQLAAEGCALVLHYRSSGAAAEALADELPVDAQPIGADLTEEAAVDAMFAEALAVGPIDGIVVNAGIWESATVGLHEMTLAQWRRTLDADLTSAFLSCRGFLRHLAAVPREDASIVMVASTAGLFGEAGHADYAAAKAAMAHGLTLSLKNEIVGLAPRGRVNCVCPGWTRTKMAEDALADPDAVRRATATMPLRKVAEPEDVARAVVYLTSPALSGHVSGEVITVAGGMEGRLLHGS